MRVLVTIARNSWTQDQGIDQGAAPSARPRMAAEAGWNHSESRRWAYTRMLVLTAIIRRGLRIFSAGSWARRAAPANLCRPRSRPGGGTGQAACGLFVGFRAGRH